jgi:hypothetical protein
LERAKAHLKRAIELDAKWKRVAVDDTDLALDVGPDSFQVGAGWLGAVFQIVTMLLLSSVCGEARVEGK